MDTPREPSSPDDAPSTSLATTASSMPIVHSSASADGGGSSHDEGHSDPIAPAPVGKRRRRPMRALGAGMLIALIGFGGGIGGFYAADQWADADSGTAARSSSSSSDSADGTDSPSRATGDDSETVRAADNSGDILSAGQIYERVAPAVVHIEARSTSTSTGFFGIPNESEQVGTGSGFLIDDDGHIVTNAHVVDGSQELTVSFGDEVTVDAKLIGEDTSTDVAVIKIDPDDKRLKDLRTVGFGDSSGVKVGDPVVAIGNPFSLDRTLTTGVVSALQRNIPALNEGYQITDVIQTDAAVNPGNSGGPLLDMSGKVIGVNSQIQTKGNGGFVGIAFAIPASTVKDIASQLIDKGEVQHAWLGLSGGELTPELASALKLDIKEGVLVGVVTDGSPAAKAGLTGGSENMVVNGTDIKAGGDVITSFDGKNVATMRELAALVDDKASGEKVEIEFIQEGRKRTATVTLATRPENSASDQ